ncbi:MAG: hypothetical protein HZA53_02640, partial [Planctomycetes bacterium]|nr:hypothetical protein [Planctomycetota bacterium]
MTVPQPDANAPRLLVSNPDPGNALRMYEALCALGFQASVVSSSEAAATVRNESSSLVVTDTAAFLRSLCERLGAARAAANDASGDDDEAAFLERAARILAVAQPPNDHVAILVVHMELPASSPADAEALEAEIARRLRACVRDRDAIGRSFLG